MGLKDEDDDLAGLVSGGVEGGRGKGPEGAEDGAKRRFSCGEYRPFGLQDES